MRYSKFEHSNRDSHNWLVHRIHDELLARLLKQYASGFLVDIGCGEKPYAVMTLGLVNKHIGVDHAKTQHDFSNIDILASAYDTTLPDTTADTILCTAVLEHLERPGEAIREMYRILRPGGYVILSSPLFWHLHEEPRDFYRYTKYGLEYLLTQSGFQVVEIVPLSGFVVTFTQELCYFLERFRSKPIGWLISIMQFVLQQMAFWLRQWDKSYNFTWMYLAVAKKVGVPHDNN